MTGPPAVRRVTVAGDGPRLAGDLHLPAAPWAAAVVCHPHPGYGGSRQTTLIRLVAESLAASGIAALRFDFRGAGESQGSSSAGRPEWDDAARALDLLAAEAGAGLPVGMAGYSFGSWVAAHQAARDDRVAALSLIAPGPVGGEPLPGDLGGCPVAVVAAEHDQVFPAEGAAAWAESVGGSLLVVPDCDHFFPGMAGAVAAAEAARLLADALGA